MFFFFFFKRDFEAVGIDSWGGGGLLMAGLGLSWFCLFCFGVVVLRLVFWRRPLLSWVSFWRVRK